MTERESQREREHKQGEWERKKQAPIREVLSSRYFKLDSRKFLCGNDFQLGLEAGSYGEDDRKSNLEERKTDKAQGKKKLKSHLKKKQKNRGAWVAQSLCVCL